MKNKILIAILSLFMINFVSAQDILNGYLVTAAKNNPGLRAKFNSYNAALEKIPQVGTLPDPQLTFGYFIMPVETKTGPQQAKISFSQMFPWFGTLSSKENVYVNAAKAKYEEFEEAKSKLYFDVKSVYYDLYFIKKSIDITLENIRILNSYRNLALIKVETGKSSGTDELRIEMELADLENQLALFKDNLFTAIVKFNNLLNVDNNDDVIIPDTLWTDDIGFSRRMMLDSINSNNHQIRKLEFLKQSFKENEVWAKKAGTPSFVVGADYTFIGDNGLTEQSGKDALFVKVGITIPLYRKKYTALVKEAVFKQKVYEDEKANKANVLETLLETGYSRYDDANRRLTLFRKQKQLASKATNFLETEYASNGKNFEEVLRMERNRLRYSLQLEKARADKQAAIAFMEYLMRR